jgi:hypothetical protein
MARLICEQSFETPLTDEQYAALSARTDRCLAQHGARWVRSYFSTDHKRMVCEFDAADAEAIRASYRSAGIAFDRVWAADLFTAAS